MAKLQYASLLSQLQRVKEQSQVTHQAMAELATIPYLQDISQQEADLLQSLMADAMDTLEGRRNDKERVWNTIQKACGYSAFMKSLDIPGHRLCSDTTFTIGDTAMSKQCPYDVCILLMQAINHLEK
ncbi:Spermatogenesis-associated protein 16 [Tupaia chinensis]|uniref:Spermatogenesis-associated protein 16 n=1 Tax=Tupaia chinensis TaxID=246437 RepID=L9KEI4_TUPCH|nr:Spermatogenesis-associated protein 16 [Tupaia chinensis]